MLSKDNKIFYFNDICLLFRVDLFDVAEYLDLDEGLLWKFRIIFDDLKSDLFLGFMVIDFKDLAVWPFAYDWY